MYLYAKVDRVIKAGDVWKPSSTMQIKLPEHVWRSIKGSPIPDSSGHFAFAWTEGSNRNQVLDMSIFAPDKSDICIKKGTKLAKLTLHQIKDVDDFVVKRSVNPIVGKQINPADYRDW